MELTNDFLVDVPVPEAWKVLTDVERIAPLMPGAQLQEVEGDEYRGIVKVKVGPITAQYKGVATFVERDEAAGKVVLKASGRDTRGQGNASALITALMTPEGGGTKVSVVTDLTITGKVAQFGRGVLAEVSAKLLGQFVDSLHADMAGGSGGSADGGGAADAAASGTAGRGKAGSGDKASAPAKKAAARSVPAGGEAEETGPGGDGTTTSADQPAGPRRIDHPEPEPVDLIEVAGGSAAKRVVPLVVAAILLLLLLRRRRTRRRGAEVVEVLS
jgi:carbon monoxide dehydrogenase subunit G